MCVIVTTPGASARPSLEQLIECERTNPHGSGVAWLRGRRVEFVKGLRAPEIHELLRGIDGPAIVHFRIASVGGVRGDLCHPFPVTHRAEVHRHGRARAVLFHNGTWSEYRRAADHFGIRFPRREGNSDTRVAAAVVARLGFRWLERFSYCRWALLDRHGIQRIGQWTAVDGCHYSNTLWRPRHFGGSYDYLQPGFFDDEDGPDGAAA